jgi:predicted RNA methylase
MAKGRESGMPEEYYWQTFFNPECIVSKLDCGGAGDVIEFGCGYGLFTVPAAKAACGTVYALDIEPQMVAATMARAIFWLMDAVALMAVLVTQCCSTSCTSKRATFY